MRLHELFDTKKLMIEVGGVGRVIYGINTTPDVKPDELVKQAKKYAFKVDHDGRPPTLKTDGTFVKIKRK